MVLENKLGLTDPAELALAEEKISKRKALELFDLKLLDAYGRGTFAELVSIHAYLFADIFDFAGKIRTVNMAKGRFRFASVMHLEEILNNIEKMPQSTFDEIVEKYVELNVAHPFRDGNGRSTRIWLDAVLKKELNHVIAWHRVAKDEYLLAMEHSPFDDAVLKALLQKALTDRINDRELYMKGIDASYAYEGYNLYKTKSLDDKPS